MTGGGVAEPWAKLRLERGESSAQQWDLVASRSEPALTVGSGPSSTWVVRGHDVKPLHFTLRWDGTCLSVADTQGAGGVKVDGEPLYAEWVALAGSARIEFGRALLVAETWNASVPKSDPPGASSGAPKSDPPRRLTATLMGVSPQMLLNQEKPAREPIVTSPRTTSSAPPPSSQAASARGSEPPAANGKSENDFRPARPSDSERPRKATLVGMPVAPITSPSSGSSRPPSDPAGPAPKPATPTGGIPSRTLLGVVGPLEARVQRLAAAASEANKPAEPRTLLEVPRGPAPASDRPPGSAPSGVVTQAEVRSVVATPTQSQAPAQQPAEPAQRIGSAWQEVAGAPRSPVPQAVLVEPEEPPRPRDTDRPSQMETQMREGAVSSRPARRGFPLQYIGIVLLTAAAYFAWLYLLDHL